MDTENAQPAEELEVETTNEQHYGLTEDGAIVLLPLAPYAATALRLYNAECAEKEQTPLEMLMIFNDFQYRSILSAVEAELSDADGDGFVPVYMIVTFSTQQAVFPHASVDTLEEALEFMTTHPLQAVGPYKLVDVHASWPKLSEPEAITE